ncbi:glycoside hydrolase family 2 TIM barrel-domain containing protein [Pedobacter gandavensis]|uniref:glycoside hydrolase family 2 TIM barrel-domain containing protein n=1 Tax=Pedobacter gandavensis TaxID=2679963 RepID=UPI00292E8F31|nr:glycoside hydrolase family 2 TIM barrel-domain containing protein [Pedobacter gandavensis]
MKNFQKIVLCCLLFAGNNSIAQMQSSNSLQTAQKNNAPGRLSPFPADPALKMSLNGAWQFSENIDKPAGKPIQVPGEWVMQGFTVNTGETAIYSKTFLLPNWKDKRIKLKFDGVSSHAVVKINGHKVAEHEGSFVPFEADVTNFLQPGQNLLEVEVQALTVSDFLACTSQYAAHTVGGILRKVTLFALPETNIADLSVVTTFDKQYKNATLQLKTKLSNESKNSSKAAIQYILKDQTGKVVLNKTIAMDQALSPGASLLSSQSFAVNNPRQWNTEHPYLYDLTTELLIEGKPVQLNHQKVGFRQVEVRGNELLVNGHPVKLRGVNRHSIHPLTGRAISPDLEIKDAELFKQGNCNFIRTSHYPPSEEFLEAADRIGLFVENESSITWIQHSASPIWGLWDYKDEKFLPYMLAANLEKMQAAKNNPSVIIWSLGNESYWSPLWQKVQDEAKAFDPTRPTAFHDQTWGGYNNGGSKADVANFHYPGIDGAAATDTMKRPTIFGEYAHLSTYNRRELLTDPGVRSAFGLPMVKMYDTMYHHKGSLGGAIWSGIDDTFHLPDGRILGYGPWGPIDGWRRPKPEYWAMKKAYSPVVIKNLKGLKITNNQLILEVENRYDFIPLSELTITYKTNNASGTIKSSIGPRQKGQLKIPVNAGTGEVYLSFQEASGFVSSEERIILKAEKPEVYQSLARLSLKESPAAYFIQQGENRFTIDKRTGIISGAENQGARILTQGPVFCLVPMNSEDGGKPNVAGDTYQNNIYPIKNYPLITLFVKNLSVQESQDSILLKMETTYSNANGTLKYVFLKNGNVKVDYTLKTSDRAAFSPYQYGMLFQLPTDFDQLNWKRRGDFSVYAPEDISRDAGTAKLNAKWLPAVEEFGKPTAAHWKDDANEMGSNDFRSTKQHIISAELRNKDNKGIKVLSNEKQSSRSWLQDSRIQFLIADYSNGGSERFYGSPFSDNRINIKDKELKGSVTFRLR